MEKINIFFGIHAPHDASARSDRAAPLAISLAVFHTGMAVRSRKMFNWLSPFSVFDTREGRRLIIGERYIGGRE
jgi:hypothetical protein